MADRKIVCEDIKVECVNDLDTTDGGVSIDTLEDAIKHVRKEYGDKYTNIFFEVEVVEEYGERYYNDKFYGTREETDEEYKTRCDLEAKRKNIAYNNDRALYERLKSRFGG